MKAMGWLGYVVLLVFFGACLLFAAVTTKTPELLLLIVFGCVWTYLGIEKEGE